MKDTNRSVALWGKASDSAAHPLTAAAVMRVTVAVALGVLLPLSTVYGSLSPFGIGWMAAVQGVLAVPVFMATLCGYVLHAGSDLFRYAAALGTVVGLRWAVSGFPRVARTRTFSAVAAFLATVITGSTLTLSQRPSLSAVLTVLSEGLLAGGFAFLCYGAERLPERLREEPTAETAVAALAVSAAALIGIGGWRLGEISPGHIVMEYLLLAVARCGGMTGGTAAGAVWGTALVLASPREVFLLPALVMGGLLLGWLSDKNRVAVSLLLPAAVTVASAWQEDITPIICLYEAVAACVLFWITPPAVWRAAAVRFSRPAVVPAAHAARQAAATRLQQAAEALAAVTETVDTVSAELSGIGAPDPISALRDGTAAVCERCARRNACRNEQFREYTDALNHAVLRLRREGTLSPGQLQGVLAECCRPEELCRRAEDGFREYLIRENAFRRLDELRRVVSDQFSGTAELMREFAEAFSAPERVDAVATDAVRREAEQLGLSVKAAVCRVDGETRRTWEILLDGKTLPADTTRLACRIGEVCGCAVSLPLIETVGEDIRLTVSEKHALRVSVGTAQLRCRGERLCGDRFVCTEIGGGRVLAVLSDGMGTGGRAAVDGAMASGLTVRLLQAGFGYASTVRLVNTALIAKGNDESLATLDIAAVNLFTGELELVKAGAGASLWLHGGQVIRLEDTSLPLGILREVTAACRREVLAAGDVLLIMSDGVSNGGLVWVEEQLQAYDARVTDAPTLARAIVDAAHRRQEADDRDDITVLALRIEKA